MQRKQRKVIDMGYSKEKIRQICGLMIFATALVLTIMYSELVFKGIVFLFEITKPCIIGGVIAFVLNLPMRAIEEKLLVKWKGKIADKCKRPISIVLAIVLLVLIVAFVIVTVLPQITTATKVLGGKIPAFLEKVVVELEQLANQYPELEDPVKLLSDLEINWDSIVDSVIGFLKNGVGSMLTSTFSVATGIIGGLVNIVIAFIFALYILSQKESLANQGTRIVRAYFSEKRAYWILKVMSLLHRNFSNFITGQCLEAVILGTLFVVAMNIFGMPYAFMVGVLIAFTSLIPVVGAFIGCAVGVFLILIENPILALWFLVMFLIIQQLEGNLIYPRVVGNSVGLPSIWVLMAVSLGGSLFGVAGMLFFIPLLATFYSLLRENVNVRNAKKNSIQGVGQVAAISVVKTPVTEEVAAPVEELVTAVAEEQRILVAEENKGEQTKAVTDNKQGQNANRSQKARNNKNRKNRK